MNRKVVPTISFIESKQSTVGRTTSAPIDRDFIKDRKQSLQYSGTAITISIVGMVLNFFVIAIALYNSFISRKQSLMAAEAMNKVDLRFHNEHAPYLYLQNVFVEQLSGSNNHSFKAGDQLNFNFSTEFTSLGKHPVKITKQRYSTILSEVVGYAPPKKLDLFLISLDDKPFDDCSLYVYSKIPYINKRKGTITIQQQQLVNLNADDFIFYSGEVYYSNVITGKHHKYKFCAMVKAFDVASFELLYSENTELS